MSDDNLTRVVSRSMYLFKLSSSLALLIAILFAYLPSDVIDISFAHYFVILIEFFIPSIKQVSLKAAASARYGLVLSSQWIFVPIYAYCFLVKCFPLSRAVRYRMRKYLPSYNRPNRLVLFIGLLIIALDLLGSLKIILWPSFYNGGYILSKNSPLFNTFFESRFVLILYAWASCIITVIFLWILALMIFQWRFTFGSIEAWERRENKISL